MVTAALHISILVAVEIKDDETATRDGMGHDGRWVVLPMLSHPHGLVVVGLQRIPHSGHRGLRISHAIGNATFMEGVDGIEMRGADIAEEAVEGGIVVGRELLEAVGVVDEVRTHKRTPIAAIHNIRLHPLT